ncbi:DEKNAAC101476 [Brettanomyces naardenensis]|uniref:DEKNAAC101476 n=1 Tax=Brettanomyces naardenensis TaxID=13370 RepID=A0A448YIA6_BRENA|nr:DEKNAAC101476 [Brettanomyces naardenensis]
MPHFPQTSTSSQFRSHKQPKYCYTCGKPIIGTLVRAMDRTFHVECFTCHDCGKPCSDKFFAEEIDVPVDQITSQTVPSTIASPTPAVPPPAPLNPTTGTTNPAAPVATKRIQVPLCEYDYFRRIDLICYTCNKAIRGSYITAVGRKYHPEHFYCEICHKVFETEDYYEHEEKIYCHYHYSRLYASHCEACKSAILKQYVEMHRGGKEQQWHPECFMIHKFWGVDVTVDCIGLQNLPVRDMEQLQKAGEDVVTSKVLFEIERRLERLTMSIWMTLSEFEESCASCISDMLHSATINDKNQGLLATGRLVLKIECLFKGVDVLTEYSLSSHLQIDYDADKYRNMSPMTKEPRSLSSKLMTYLTFLRDTDQERLADPKYSRELLSLISTMAHYIKLISRNSLMHALEYNRLTDSTVATDRYMREISAHEVVPTDVFPMLSIPYKAKDQCFACGKSIEDDCYRFGNDKRWHHDCLKCSQCGKALAKSSVLNEVAFNSEKRTVLCESCASDDVNAVTGFKEVSRYLQLVYLLKIALVRSEHAMEKRGLIGSTLRSLQPDDRYSQQVSDVKRMRSLRQNRKVGTATNEIRKSVIVEAPEADTVELEKVSLERQSEDEPRAFQPDGSVPLTIREVDTSEEALLPAPTPVVTSPSTSSLGFPRNLSLGHRGSKRLRIEDVPMDSKPGNVNLDATSNLLKNEKGLTLDDIPRIVWSEQAREYRPNAFRFQKRNYETTASTLPVPKPVQKRRSDASGMLGVPLATNAPSVRNSTVVSSPASPLLPEKAAEAPQNNLALPKRFSELTACEHEYMRHVAAFALHSLLEDRLSLEDCLSFIDIRRSPSFWGKIFNSGNGGKKSISDPKKIFGVPLEAVSAKYGVDSDLGVGPEKLHIPMLVDELINAMHTKDLSAEGVFRLNGNIRRLKKLIAKVDSRPDAVPDLYSENPIQLAALLKRFARELPDPLLTFRLYDLFVLSEKYTDSDSGKRDRIIQLAYCMLPKPNRDLTEVLLSFLNWVATFSRIDEETGSKMDIHNLATVLTPNILYSKPKSTGRMPDVADLIPNGESHFLAIEVVSAMIENQDQLSIVPSDLLDLYKDSGLATAQTGKGGLSTKEIIAKCKTAYDRNPGVLEN